MIASFKDANGAYCRVFAAPATGGIACRGDDGWTLRRAAGEASASTGAYRQARAGDAEMLAAAQDMMAGDPLDAAGEAARGRRGAVSLSRTRGRGLHPHPKPCSSHRCPFIARPCSS